MKKFKEYVNTYDKNKVDKNYKGLDESLDRFKSDLQDRKVRLLFKIAYKIGYDKALTIKEKK